MGWDSCRGVNFKQVFESGRGEIFSRGAGHQTKDGGRETVLGGGKKVAHRGRKLLQTESLRRTSYSKESLKWVNRGGRGMKCNSQTTLRKGQSRHKNKNEKENVPFK